MRWKCVTINIKKRVTQKIAIVTENLFALLFADTFVESHQISRQLTAKK